MSRYGEEKRTSGGLVAVSIVLTLAFYSGLAAVIILATQHRAEAVASVAGEEGQAFQCRYLEEGRFVQLEVTAIDWQGAEAQVCGGALGDVLVPPLLARGYRNLIQSPERDALLMAQRESCSCSDGELPPVLQNVSIVEAPKLGTKKKRNALPRIVNNPEEIEHNAVNPEVKPDETPPPPEEKKRKKSHKPDLDNLLKKSENFDDARPSNQDEDVGDADGSRFGKGPGKGDPYLQKVKARLENSLTAPSSIPRSELKGLKARVTLHVIANGKLSKWRFRAKSGNKAFDAMVERTLKRFEIGGDTSFPSPPKEWILEPMAFKIDGSKIQ